MATSYFLSAITYRPTDVQYLICNSFQRSQILPLCLMQQFYSPRGIRTLIQLSIGIAYIISQLCIPTSKSSAYLMRELPAKFHRFPSSMVLEYLYFRPLINQDSGLCGLHISTKGQLTVGVDGGAKIAEGTACFNSPHPSCCAVVVVICDGLWGMERGGSGGPPGRKLRKEIVNSSLAAGLQTRWGR